MAIEDSANSIKFTSLISIDKIIKDDGAASFTVGAGRPAPPTASTETQPNDTGFAAIPNAMFSVDGTNFYPAGVRIPGPVDPVSLLQQYAECVVAASASTVFFYLQNGFTSSKTFTIRYTLESVA